MIVIGLSGQRGAGKDTVADILVSNHGFTKMSFAGAVKRLLLDLDPIVGYDIYQDCICGGDECGPLADEIRLSDLYAMGYDDETVKESPWADEVRNLWQRFGTDTMRAHDPEFWVNLALDDLGKQDSGRIVFTDVRFPNEAEMIFKLSGPFFSDGDLTFSLIKSSVWQVGRPDAEADGHESEQWAGLLDEEITILNDGTIEDLAVNVKTALGITTGTTLAVHQPPLWEEGDLIVEH